MKKHIWISTELSEIESQQKNDNNVDVIVTLPDRTRWWGTFFTYQNIETLRRKNKNTGENLSGTYLWSINMVIVEDVSRETIEKVVDELIREGDLQTIMAKIDDVSSDSEAEYGDDFFE
ncbi:hypothetical protein ABE237_17045 [Brevibacillus formosus]|uniref:hypothetical protein n=1 Tax=Brevibacillus TaxID=55080 RepID=UPI000D0FF783|nr:MULTISPECIES: hypothetical protein [Brevibacillus]MBG9944391.1 hypothetical protein [Brevibacillus formosus]MBY0088210.1 hypothetical protein [Brevibacillus brevis]MCC8435423.1 hypothetical protein [Brevibacillus sp. M2.1A]MED1946278.1 hypothetical protein [Brevibacillus formosus]MED1998800.1 hypothetical protein [Brevibacillus formosus]